MLVTCPRGLVTTAPVLHCASDELQVPAAVGPVTQLSKFQVGVVLQSPHNLPDLLGDAEQSINSVEIWHGKISFLLIYKKCFIKLKFENVTGFAHLAF